MNESDPTLYPEQTPTSLDTVAPSVPERIGRYRVVRILGEGGFGRVYEGQDDQLRRSVAIKVPHPHLIARPEDVEAYLAEARTLACLDHPNIVPVHDVGRTENGLCFVVSKLIEGSDLTRRLRHGRLSFVESATLTATVAESLHHAHRKGLVHRDIKPANILIDGAGKPYVADFGLALREEDFGKGAGFAGTPAYMSPEQARGESHRVDGRSDVFSLGVVFYEMLTGRRPFRGETSAELLQHIAAGEVRPPRQVDDAVPRELERICLKALARRASDRYTTAADMAENLRHWLAAAGKSDAVTRPQELGVETVDEPAASTGGPTPSPLPPSSSGRQNLKIVPKGLRAFDAHDADFFLELLPGPRDRDGLPEGLRFWKTRVEESDPDATFAVGLIYGPSGCGKSSLVRAGLLPRLTARVVPVYVEASAEGTEARLLSGLRKRFPDLPGDTGLKECLALLRRGQGMSAGGKVLLVLDQFEQWLHAHGKEEGGELVEALRQCDGGRVQCLVLVRDEFWLAVSRFMQALEIQVNEGRNSALADLFPPRHAEKVLGAFGRALGAFPDGELDADQKRFLQQAVREMAEGGKVVPIRLALFAELMKARPWTSHTLRQVGGASGVGTAFLEETFSAANAPPEHRYHQKAARAVLQALLPEPGSDIRGHTRSRAELLSASGYASRPRDFEGLLRVLEGEVRLIAPADLEGAEDDSLTRVGAGERPYQLTHDYLVPSLRDWLTRKQRETRRGRAELRLAEQAALWNARPENRFLPAWWEWLSIRLATRARDWTAPQRVMMRKAARYHTARGVALAALLLAVILGAREALGRLHARTLRDRLMASTVEDVPAVVRDMAPYRRWVNPLLRDEADRIDGPDQTRRSLYMNLALLPVDPDRADGLLDRLLAGSPSEVVVLREALRPHYEDLTDRLWRILESSESRPGERLRAACALAVYADRDPRWEMVGASVIGGLLEENALTVGRWAEVLRPVGNLLLPALGNRLIEEGRRPADRAILVRLYLTYASDAPTGFGPLEKGLSDPGLLRRAHAASALAAMGRWDTVRPLLRHVADPTFRTYLIDRLGSGDVEARALFAALKAETEPAVRQALLLALGGLGAEGLSSSLRDELLTHLTNVAREDPDAGVHGAAVWALRRLGQEPKLVGVSPLKEGRWYVNGQGQTMVIVPRPDEFGMGEKEEYHRRRIGRGFALATHEVTVAEFLRFQPKHEPNLGYAPTNECPVNKVTWFEAAEYCNWLSKEEGIPPEQHCYLGSGEALRPASDFLKRTGYRLPTESEWEYACRAGTTTDWSHGNVPIDLFVQYAWIADNSGIESHPVGRLRPNGLGLFDMHGNTGEWCHDRRLPLSEASAAEEGRKEKLSDFLTSGRVVRGGSFFKSATRARSGLRSEDEPTSRGHFRGFRVARTVR